MLLNKKIIGGGYHLEMNSRIKLDCLIREWRLKDKQSMEKEPNYDNDGLDPSEEYFRKKKKGNDEDTYFPPEESEPPHY